MNTITPRTVRQALRVMRQALPLSQNPLRRLAWVQQTVQGAGPYASNKSVERVINHLLVHLLLDRLNHYRTVEGLPYAELDQSRKDALNSFTRDFQTPSDHLKAWSVLFFRYARVDLNLQVQTMARRVDLSERQIQRYAENGYYYLTQQISMREEETRRRAWPEWLRLKLPALVGDSLVGQEQTMADLLGSYKKGSRCIHLTGLRGIGKTQVAYTFAIQLLMEELIDDVVWLDLQFSTTPSQLLESLAWEVGFPGMIAGGDLSLGVSILNRHLADHRILIVVDNAHYVQEIQLAVRNILSLLSNGHLILVSHQPLPISLPELRIPPIRSSIAYYDFLVGAVRALRIHQHNRMTPQLADAIRDVTVGHPLAGQCFVRHLQSTPAEYLLQHIDQLRTANDIPLCDYLFAEAWAAVDAEAQCIAYAIQKTADEKATWKQLERWFPATAGWQLSESLRALIVHGLVERRSDTYHLHRLAAVFLERQEKAECA